ncbi:MAG: hypothetical protein R2867_18885 [Caldilineaceae bacterium]
MLPKNYQSTSYKSANDMHLRNKALRCEAARYESTAAKMAILIAAMLMAMTMIIALSMPMHAESLTQQTTDVTGGTGPDNALTPTGQPAMLAPGATRWYTFLYAEGADGDGEPSDAVAELEMAQPGAITFEVWTEDDVRRWQNGEDFSPTGAGTPAFDPDSSDNRDRGRLTWVGSGAATTTWYIVVMNQSDQAASFSLSVTGPDVYFPEANSASQSGAVQNSQVQTDTVQSGTAQTDTVQTGTAQTDTVQAGTAQTDTVQAGNSTAVSDMQSTMNGSGPATALTPTGMRRTLAPGESHWYTFRYAEGIDAENPSEAVVEAAISRPNSIDFEVWTEDDVNRWANGEDFTPTGAGTPAFAIEDGNSDNRDRRLLRWVGSGAATTTWYVIVENSSDAPAAYRLTVTGPDVFFPTQDATDAASAASPMTATDAMTNTGAMTTTGMISETTATTSTGGTGPNDALRPTGQQSTLAPNEIRWYTFRYTGGADDENPENVIAELRMAQPGAIEFEVWTEEDVQSWLNGDEFNPTGVGTPAFTIEDDANADNRDRTLLRWVGSGQATTTWYIVVENNEDTPQPYRLTVTGPDVGF